MFKFVDGMPVLLNFSQLESMYYRAFIDRFNLDEQAVSITQWRGSYEYQAIYPEIQLMVENGVIMSDSLDHVMGTIAAENEAIYRPAALQTRVSERFAQEGYEATIRVADINTRGIVAICVDQDRSTATHLTRSMTVGTNSTHFGYDSFVPFGAIDNLTFQGKTIVLIETNPDGRTVLGFDEPVTAGTASNELFVWFPGSAFERVPFGAVDDNADPVIGASDQFVSYHPDIKAWIDSNSGQAIPFYFEADDVAADDDTIGALIRDELYPAGQFIEGNVSYDTALSSGQAVTIRWTTPREYTNIYRVTITKLRNTQHPIDTPEAIISMFNATYASMMGIGLDITPARYLTTDDLPWAASVVVEFEKGDGSGGTFWTSEVYPVAFTDRHLANLPPENVIIQ